MDKFIKYIRKLPYQYIFSPYVKKLLISCSVEDLVQQIDHSDLDILEAILYELDIDYSNVKALTDIRDAFDNEPTISDLYNINTFNLVRLKEKFINYFIPSKQAEIRAIIDNLPSEYCFKAERRFFSILYLSENLKAFNFLSPRYNHLNDSIIGYHYSRIEFISIDTRNAELIAKIIKYIANNNIIVKYIKIDIPENISLKMLEEIYDLCPNNFHKYYFHTSNEITYYKYILEKSAKISLDFYSFVVNIVVNSENYAEISQYLTPQLNLANIKKSA